MLLVRLIHKAGFVREAAIRSVHNAATRTNGSLREGNQVDFV